MLFRCANYKKNGKNKLRAYLFHSQMIFHSGRIGRFDRSGDGHHPGGACLTIVWSRPLATGLGWLSPLRASYSWPADT